MVCTSVLRVLTKLLQNNTELTSMHNRTFGNIIYIVVMEKDSQPSIIQEVIIYSLARKCPPSYQHFWSHHHLSADTEANLT